MSLLYQAYLLKRKKGAREENKADLFDNTVHYWGEGEANNGSYLPAVGVGGWDKMILLAHPLPNIHSTESQRTLSFTIFSS